MAAETHVDNSIESPVSFVDNNIKSTLNLLEYARRLPRLSHFIYFSTDEVFGSAAEGEASSRPRRTTRATRTRRRSRRRR